MAQLVYNPGVFNVDTMDKAKQMSVIAGTAIPDKVRWGEEIKMLCTTMARELMLRRGDLILDYGCGVGRLAKELVSMGWSRWAATSSASTFRPRCAVTRWNTSTLREFNYRCFTKTFYNTRNFVRWISE